jgi:dihydrofolate reductase
MQFFKETTLNKVVIMGDTTFYSLPGKKALKNRINIVLTLDPNFNEPDTLVAHDFKQLSQIISAYDPEDVFVIGGASVYTQLIPYCKKGYITKIRGSKPADRFLPNLDVSDDWEMILISPDHEEDGYKFNFCVYQNNNPKPFKFD